MALEVPSFTQADIERAVISSMMQWDAALAEGAQWLSEDHFLSPTNRILFRELFVMWEKGIRFDLIVFTEHLNQNDILNTVGGTQGVTRTYLEATLQFVPSPAAIKYYIGLLDEELDGRKIAAIGKTMLEPGTDTLETALQELSAIPLKKTRTRSLTDALHDKLDRMQSGDPDEDIVLTGLVDLDRLSPLRKGDMPLIAGERKAGKSILALTIATNIAKNGTAVLYFSLEDREPKVIDRLFAGLSRLPASRHHVKRMTEADMATCSQVVASASGMSLHIRDDVYDLHAIIAVTRQAKAQHAIGLVVIDYAQLVRAKADTRRESVEKVSRDLRLLAMELNTPILLLCQLNKEGETRETMALEMDATAMWRIETIDEDNPRERRIVIPWQRNGESMITFPVVFLGEIARVESAERKP